MSMPVDARQPCLDTEFVSQSPDIPRKHLTARLTSFNLISDLEASGGFGVTAETADRILTQNIFPCAPKNKGFVDLQRFVDTRSGEFKILSLWESTEDCQASYNNDEYYAANLRNLRDCARHGTFKTEHFNVWQLHPTDGYANPITSPYVRTSTMELAEDSNSQEKADEVLASIMTEAKSQPGFLGSQRLLGSGDAEGTYKIVTYWDSWNSLKTSSRGSKYYDSYLPVLRSCLKTGTDVITDEFDHLHYEATLAAIPGLDSTGGMSAVFQLASISFGVGVFEMPTVFARFGIPLGTCVLIAFAIFSDMSMQLMLKTAKATGASTYEDVMYIAFGPVGRVLALVGLAISTFTANCAHMQFVSSMFVEMQGPGGGIMATLVGPNVRLQHFATMVIFGSLALPLCFKRQLNELRFVSLGVVIFCFVACAVVLSKCCLLLADDGFHNTSDVWPIRSVGVVLDTAPLAAFGFSSIAELFHVRAEVKNPEIMGQCAHVATMIVVGLYFTVGLIGSMTFENPGSNLLQNFPDDHLVAIIRLAIIAMVTMLYPIINFPCAQAVEALIAGRFGSTSSKRWKFHAVAGLILVLLVDTLVTALDAVFGLCGSLGLGLIAYVLPAAATIVVAMGWARRPTSSEPLPGVSRGNVVWGLLILAVGLIMTFGSTAWIIRGVVVGS